MILGFYESVLVEDVEKFFSAHLPRVTTDRTEHLQESSTLAVFCRCYVLQVVYTPIKDVAVEVVDFQADRSWPEPRECHEKMKVFATEVRMDLRIARVACDAIVVQDDVGFAPM